MKFEVAPKAKPKSKPKTDGKNLKGGKGQNGKQRPPATPMSTAHALTENWDDEEEKAQQKLAEIQKKKEDAAAAAKLLAERSQRQRDQAKDYNTANTLTKKYMKEKDDLTVVAHHDLMFLHFYVVV